MTVLFLSTFLSVSRKISDMQRFLKCLGCKSVCKQQEGKFKLPRAKIIIICSSQWRVLKDHLGVGTQAKRGEAGDRPVLLRMKPDCG